MFCIPSTGKAATGESPEDSLGSKQEGGKERGTNGRKGGDILKSNRRKVMAGI
jgi:hypothetical protein